MCVLRRKDKRGGCGKEEEEEEEDGIGVEGAAVRIWKSKDESV